MSLHLTLRQLQVFAAVARNISYTHAAEELHLTQPAVSMQVKQLESATGLALIEQVGKRVQVTEAGREIQRCAMAVAECIEESAARIEALKGGRGGHLRVSVATTVNYFAPRLLAAFCREYPEVRVTLDVTNRETLLQQLAENAADVVLMGSPPQDAKVDAQPFLENPLVLIAPPGHRLAGSDPVPLSALEHEIILTREPGSGTRRAFEGFCREHGLRYSARIEMRSNEAIKQSVEAGLGLGVVSAHTIELELQAGRLITLDVAHFPMRRKWYVMHRHGKRLPPVAEAFERFVIATAPGLGARSPRLAGTGNV